MDFRAMQIEMRQSVAKMKAPFRSGTEIMLALTEEVGEVAREVALHEHIGTKAEWDKAHNARRRLTWSAVLFGVLLLAGVGVVLFAGIAVFRNSRGRATSAPAAISTATHGPAAAALTRGDAAFEQGDNAAAIAAYSDAIALNPNLAEAYNNRGLAYYRLNNAAAALADYNRALRLRPDYAYALTNRAIVVYDTGDFAAVIADTSRAIELDPQDDSAYVFRGNAYLRVGDYARALADMLKANSLRMQRRAGGL